MMSEQEQKHYSDRQWKTAILMVMYEEPNRTYIQCEVLDYAYEWLIRNGIEPEKEEEVIKNEKS